MLIKIGQFEFTECWDGVLYKKLSDYPRIIRKLSRQSVDNPKNVQKMLESGEGVEPPYQDLQSRS